MTIELQPGASFDEYVLERRLGGGGFGDVWLSRNPAGERVALKVLHGQYQSSEMAALRAEIELLAAQASSRSSHIVHVLGGGSEPAPFVVMEYIEGEDLSRKIALRGALAMDEVLSIAEGIADALATLQRAGIIHRDIKPANVIIDNQGVVKLTDFGIAKIVGVDSATATGQISLSMAYAAPEVWDGKASQLSDHYAFGALLFQCITGRAVFSGNYAEIYRHHLQTPPDLDALPAITPFALREMIADCLAKAPEQRPQNATLLLAAIEAARQELNGDSAATVVVTLNVEPKRLGPWVIDSRASDREWTFVCSHQTSSENALLELYFSDDLDYAQTLRKAVDVNSSLVPLGAEKLIGTSRLVLRPGEAWQNAPKAEFQFWVAREVSTPVAPPRSISTTELQKATDTLNEFLAVAKANDLQLDMRADNLALRPDATVLIRRPGLPPFPATDPTADVIAFLETLPLDQQTIIVTPEMTAALARPSVATGEVVSPPPPPAEASSVVMAPPPPSIPSAAIAAAPAARRDGRGSKKLVLAGAALGAIVAVAVAAFLVLRSSHSNSKNTVATTYGLPAANTTPTNGTPSASGTPSSSSPASAAFVTQGIAAATAKDYDGALKAFTGAIEADPKNSEAYFRRGLSYVALTKPDQALPDFSKAIELVPTMASYYVARGDLYKTQKKTDQAIADYTKAISLDAQNVNAYFDRGTLYGDTGNADAAIADLSKAIDLNPKGAPAYNNRGVVYRNTGKADLAIADYTKAIELDPKYVLPVANRGRLYYDQKRYDESLADASKAIELDPSSLHYVSRGTTYSALGKSDLAAADYSKAVQIDPKNAVAYYDLASYDLNQKLYDDAILNSSKSIDIDPNYFLVVLLRGQAYKAESKTDQARADFEKAKTLAKTADETQRAQAALDSVK